MRRLLAIFLALIGLGWAMPAAAEVKLSFHSFNGSMFFGRYPHTFIVMKGTLDANGQKVDENYGFTAKNVTPAVLSGPVYHEVVVEPEKWVNKTNRHFTVTISDAKYYEIRAEVDKWRNAPGKYYDIDSRNCIHFVGRIAQMVGIRVDYPKKMLRKPKAWLNYLTGLNPKLGAKVID
jgi:hypothetical protein